MSALVVDDSKAMRTILRRILSQLGEEDIHEAVDGVDALELLETINPPDVALVDWNLPRMNGIDLVRTLRADETYDTTKIVMVTSETQSDRVIMALEAGADEYIMKPFNASILQEKLGLLSDGAL